MASKLGKIEMPVLTNNMAKVSYTIYLISKLWIRLSTAIILVLSVSAQSHRN